MASHYHKVLKATTFDTFRFSSLFLFAINFRVLLLLEKKYICYLTRGGPYWEKLSPRSWVCSRPRPRPRRQFFSIRTDLGRQITCLLYSLGNHFIRNICVDFILKQFHTVHVHLTFRDFFQGFFVWIIKFTFAMIAVIIQIHNCLTFCPMFTFHVDLSNKHLPTGYQKQICTHAKWNHYGPSTLLC